MTLTSGPRLVPDTLTSMSIAEQHAIAAPQINAAERHLDRIEQFATHWPISGLGAITGPLGMGGDVWIVCAATGGGKTSFVASCIQRWARAGKRVYVMPLETEAHRFRTILACLDLEIHPGEALSGQLKKYVDGADQRRALIDAVRNPHPNVHIDPQSRIDLRGLDHGLKQARRFDADVIVIDHIDHIGGGEESARNGESKRVCNTLLDLAQANELLVLATSQLNMESMRGGDRLARYAPPQLNHLWMPGVKTQIATGIVGVFRPLRPRGENETAKEFSAAMGLAKAGIVEPHTMLMPATMGAVAMKLRNAGHLEGKRVLMPFRRGGIRDDSPLEDIA